MTFHNQVTEIAEWLLNSHMIPVGSIPGIVTSYCSLILKNYLEYDPLTKKDLHDLFSKEDLVDDIIYHIGIPKNSFTDLLFETLNKIPENDFAVYKNINVIDFLHTYHWNNISYDYYHILYKCVRTILKS